MTKVVFILAWMLIFSDIRSSIFFKERISFRILITISVAVMGWSVILYRLRISDILYWLGVLWTVVSRCDSPLHWQLYVIRSLFLWYPLYRSDIRALPLPFLVSSVLLTVLKPIISIIFNMTVASSWEPFFCFWIPDIWAQLKFLFWSF